MAKKNTLYNKTPKQCKVLHSDTLKLNHCGQWGSVTSNQVQSCDAHTGYLTPHSCQPNSQSQMLCLSSSNYVFESADFCDRR